MHSTSLVVACGEGLRQRVVPFVPPQVTLIGPQPLRWTRRSGLLEWEWEVPAAALEGLQEVLPCLSTLSTSVRRYGFALACRSSDDPWEHEVWLDRLGRAGPGGAGAPAAPPAAGASASPVEAAVDVLVVKAPVVWARLRLCVETDDPDEAAAASTLVTASLRRAAVPAGGRALAASPEPAASLPVPALSQMLLRPDLARRVCSPTCVAMVLGALGRPADVYEVIERAYHPERDLYGVWPANVQAAAHWGVMGYLLHVPTWQAARHLLEAGVPVVASVRYEEGELSRAAVRRTSGHLVVVRGYGPGTVLVNDPAADATEGVPRTYDLQEFLSVWLGRSSVAYVLFAA